MLRNLTIRSKVIFAIILFTLLLFGWIELRHDAMYKQQIINAETSRNILLIETIMPVVGINFEFGLENSNRSYLDDIILKNPNIMELTLENRNEKSVYHSQNHTVGLGKGMLIEKIILDSTTADVLGTLSIRFSYLNYKQLQQADTHLNYEFFIIVIVALSLFVLLLDYLMSPLKILHDKIKKFDPQNNTFPIRRTTKSDEAGVFQNALAEMIERMNVYTRELDDLTKNLELKVADRTEQLRLQKEKLESKVIQVKEQEQMLIAQSRLAAMGEMMSMIAHQWRQPLATTTLMITDYNFKSLFANSERDERDEILQKISDILLYLSDTVDDFQTYFKPETHADDTSINDVVKRAVQFTQPRLSQYSIQVELKCNEMHTVKTYVNELVQVIINIINNAIDALKESRKNDRRIVIKTQENDQEIILSISDNGGGIAQEMIERVFEPYFSTKGKNGTGLGLYMSKMIIDKHAHGKIWVENTNEGAMFSIAFKKNA